MQHSNQKLDTILLFDGIAIFFIVLLHELNGNYHEVGKEVFNPLISLSPYLVTLGLTLFTFSSGYKLMVTHSDKLDQRDFLSKYYIKRFVRLYKPYIGYTLLMVFPLLLGGYFVIHYFHLNFLAISVFFTTLNNITVFSFLSFLFGNNPVAGQLWYLVALIEITSICFTILYFLNIKWLFLSFIPFLLISFLIKFGIINLHSSIINSVFNLLPFFIFGCYWVYNQQHYQTANWFKITCFSIPVFIVLLTLSIIFSQNQIINSILIYLSCFFFPLFLLSLFDYVKKIKFLYPFLIFCGTYSFQIYLFQGPLVLPVLNWSIVYLLNINYVFMPILISIIAVYCCVIVYEIVKKVHLNMLFE
jgi:peptidoglycan/LPS O-acetylase OafA/YrhL